MKLRYVHEQWYAEVFVTNLTNEVYPLAQNEARMPRFSMRHVSGEPCLQEVLTAMGPPLN